jgi:hypothetical protein
MDPQQADATNSGCWPTIAGYSTGRTHTKSGMTALLVLRSRLDPQLNGWFVNTIQIRAQGRVALKTRPHSSTCCSVIEDLNVNDLRPAEQEASLGILSSSRRQQPFEPQWLYQSSQPHASQDAHDPL